MNRTLRNEWAAVASSVDLLVRHGCLITMSDARAVLPDGAVAITNGVIVDVGTDADLSRRYSAAQELDAGGAPVHPGLVEAHLHCSYQLFRSAMPDSLAEDHAFGRVESRFYQEVDDDDEHASTLLAALEMIRHGTTAFLEPGTVLTPDAAAAAAETVGIRAVLGDPFIWDDPEGLAMGKIDTPRRNTSVIPRVSSDRTSVLGRLGAQLHRNRPDALVTGHIAVLGLGTASIDLLREAKALANEAGVVLNLHQSYSPADTARDRLRYGREPIVALTEMGIIDRTTTMAHVNHVSRGELDAIAAVGASVAWAPAASMMWGHGSTLAGHHAALHRRRANVALGSDSSNWSNRLDLFHQATLAVLTAREGAKDRTALNAEDAMWMATRAGARALGLEGRIGSIEIGKRADIVIHSLRRPELHPLTDPVRSLIHSAGSATVDSVIVDGRIVLRRGRFDGLDEEAILDRASRRSRALLTRMGYYPPRDTVRTRTS